MRPPAAASRDEMIRRYLPLARKLAWRYRHTSEPMDDLVQVASLGLVKAVDRWDPARGFAFSTYAVPTILGELRRHFREAAWVVRPPRGMQELALAVERSLATDGREPDVAELAEQLERSPDEIRAALVASEARWTRAVDDETRGDTEDAPPRPLATVDDGYAAAEARATLQRLGRVLDGQTREILRLRFEEDLLQREIAERVGCSQMHVSRLLRRGMERLQVQAAA